MYEASQQHSRQGHRYRSSRGLAGFQDLIAPGADRIFTSDPGSR